MERELVAEVVGDLLMDHEVMGEGVQVPHILDALFKGAGEVGRHADGGDALVVKLVAHHKVLGGGGDGQGLVDGQLKIHGDGLDLVDVAIAVDGVPDALVEHDDDPLELIGGQAPQNGQRLVQVHALIVGPDLLRQGSVEGVDLTLGEGDGLLVDLLGAVQRHHGAAGGQGVLDLVPGLEMVAVGAVALLVPLLEHVEGCGGYHVLEGPVGEVQLPDGLLGQDRIDVMPAQSPDVAGGGEAQPIAEAHGELVALVAGGLSIGEQTHESHGVFVGQGAEPEALLLGAGEPVGLFAGHGQKLFKAPADQGGHGPLVFVHGTLVHKQVGVGKQGTELIYGHVFSPYFSTIRVL